MSVTYITYGITKDTFSKDVFYSKLTGGLPCKPNYGLWGSRVDAPFGWKDWNESEEFVECIDSKSMKYTLDSSAKIFEVHCEDDILPYIDPYKPNLNFRYSKTSIMDTIRFDKLMAEGYDGLELFISDNYSTLHSGVFNTWDCDSIVVWNAEIIRII